MAKQNPEQDLARRLLNQSAGKNYEYDDIFRLRLSPKKHLGFLLSQLSMAGQRAWRKSRQDVGCGYLFLARRLLNQSRARLQQEL